MKRTHPTQCVWSAECITQSLFRLMKRKPYHKITVTDLVREAGVSPQFPFTGIIKASRRSSASFWRKELPGGGMD